MIHNSIKKVLVLGSGALKIGEAGEFDYSGSQAIKALKEERIQTVLVNPNIATIQTSKLLSDKVYFLPVNDYFVEKIIEKEKPDGILLSFGGQTALNCGLSLYKKGVLEKHNVQVLGTPVSAIELSEDRDAFANHLKQIDIKTPPSKAATTIEQAKEIASLIGYPIMVRSGFALGGQGSGVITNQKDLEKLASKAFSFVSQILVEKYLHHFKEVEYEVVRDKDDNCVTVCNMENMDPLGIHTGESIVIAPSQTLTNYEYHTLREIAIKIVRSLGIIGECNVQFALNPNPSSKELDYYVIELNARLSRSSALASKATGYPLAYVAAKLALGKNLTELTNKITKVTQFCFEPALDYVTVKIPRWDIDKFRSADPTIGTSMKSVGEVMGIGRTFEEAYQKAIRMLDLNFSGAVNEDVFINGDNNVKDLLKYPTPKRIFAIAKALLDEISVEEINKLTGIDPWFIFRIQNIVKKENELKKYAKSNKEISKSFLLELKQLGCSDKRIGELIGKEGLEIRTLRKKYTIFPSVLQIDTLAGEFPAETNYLYLTYNAQHNDIKPSGKDGVIVLGSGPYRIGSSVEFDWTSVSAVQQLKKHKKQSIIINCNPETVSTDYDISDKLYFEELTFERIADIYDFENPYGVIVSVGGQTPNNRAASLTAYGAPILGTSAENINRAEERNTFSKLLDDLSILQPPWNKFISTKDAILFSQRVGFPVIVRPSYVLSGTFMRVCRGREELTSLLNSVSYVSKEYPITVSKFIEYAKEIELDAVASKGEIKAFVISEHVEHAGVHSGDATIVLPAQHITEATKERIVDIAKKLAKELSISGPFNIQFLAKEDKVSVIETNLRASRTFPFISKVTGIDFIELAVDSFFGKKSQNIAMKNLDFVSVKVPQFSFARLIGADPLLHVEMASTGEVACFGQDSEEAFLKGEIAVGGRIPTKGIFLTFGGEENKQEFLQTAMKLPSLGLPMYATEKTHKFLKENGISTEFVYKIHDKKEPSILTYFQEGKVDLVINFVESHIEKHEGDHYTMRRAAIDYNIPLFTNMETAKLFVKAITTKTLSNLLIKSWDQYVS